MAILVQKFGGTSVADSTKILAAARKAIRAQQEGYQVVMVVSAMGKNTDLLVELAHQVNERPPAREMDMLLSTGEQVSVALMAMAIDSLGYKAVSLTGAQIGIRTDSTHTKARIRSISTDRMRRLLDEGYIVIAAGFQGIDEDFNITTLGRGGSDTTAVALAAVLDAACEIYTDVDGVYTSDPRVVPEARRLYQISYDEMLELASLGAGVMHSRSIEFAKKYAVPIHVRGSHTDAPGTLIGPASEAGSRPVSGAAVTRDEARITVRNVPDVPGTSHAIFSRIAARNVSVDMIVQNVGQDGRADISFTVPRNELGVTLEAVRLATFEWEGASINHDDHTAKISVVGLGMAQQTGVAERMFGALAAEGINIQMITTSEIKISALIDRDQAIDGLRAVHRAFQLDHAPAELENSMAATPTLPARSPSEAADVVARLQHLNMEDLTISGLTLDDHQGRVSLHGIPDRPGIAQRLFQELAQQDIFVDMIVQSYSDEGQAAISFTVNEKDVDRSVRLVRQLCDQLQCHGVSHSPRVAKLSVSGIGLRSHTGVAIRMFRALARASINVMMINTSEVRVNVVVDGQHGKKGLECLSEAFSDVLR